MKLGTLLIFTLCVSFHFIFANRTEEFLVNDGHGLAIIHPLYGIDTITEPVLIDLIQSKEVQRLKKINQYGANEFLKPVHYTRYDYSIGVFMLLLAYNASLLEQIAGLLHDVSHTIFSHTGDWLFQVTQEDNTYTENPKDSFQDTIHSWYLNKGSIRDILARYEITIESILHKNESFVMFERSIPDLCMDRIEYNIYGGYIENYLSKDDVAYILAHLHFNGDVWYLSDQKAARQLALVSMHLSEHSYTSVESNIIKFLTVRVLEAAQKNVVISSQDIFFSTDERVWYALENTLDPEVRVLMERLHAYQNYSFGDEHTHDLVFTSKARCVDPFVRCGDELVRLSAIDEEFVQMRQRYEAHMTTPTYIRFN